MDGSSEDKLLKNILLLWLTLMCTMDYFFPLGTWQTRLLMWGMNGLFFAAWAMQRISQKRVFTPFRERGVTIALYLFLFWACLSIFLSQSPSVGIRRIFPLLVGIVDAYIFYDFFSHNQENVYFFAKSITFFMFSVSIWTALESLQKLSQGESLFKNIYAGFCNQNFLGYFLFLFTPLMISYYLVNSPFQGRYRLRRLTLLSLIIYALIMSSSRSSWIGVVFALFFLLFRKSKALGTGALFVAVILALSIYILRGGGIYQNIWQQVYNDRAVAWDIHWKIIMEHPFFGIGWGVDPKGARHGHSIYLSDGAQMGVFSIFLLLAFYLTFFYSSLQIEKRVTDPHLKAILLGSTATYFGQIFYGLTDLSGILVAFSATSVAFPPYMLVTLPLAIKNLIPQPEENHLYGQDRIISTAAS